MLVFASFSYVIEGIYFFKGYFSLKYLLKVGYVFERGVLFFFVGSGGVFPHAGHIDLYSHQSHSADFFGGKCVACSISFICLSVLVLSSASSSLVFFNSMRLLCARKCQTSLTSFSWPKR